MAGGAKAPKPDVLRLERLVTRFGGTLRLVWYEFLMDSELRVNDWGPYDYHKDFNLTFPLQVSNQLSFGLGPAVFGMRDCRLGVRTLLRTLDQYSEGYLEDATGTGLEYEVGTYLNVSL